MGQMEKDSRKRKKRRDIQKFVLASVAVTGGLAVAMVAPNVLGAMAKLGIIPTKRETEVIKRSRQRLLQLGLLSYSGNKLRLTQKGEEKLRLLEIKDLQQYKPKRWDGRWRVLIFDIPESRRKDRARVRELLKHIGFIRLQDSVWLYPYDCEDIITLIKADLKVGKDVLYIIADTLEYDTPHLSHFKLRRIA